MRAIVLAAGRGKRFGRRTRILPKCLIPLRPGMDLLSRYFDAFRRTGIRDVVVVVGHQQDKIRRACKRFGEGSRIRFVENRDYRKGSVVSLHRAGALLNADVLIMDADVFFPVEFLQKLLRAPARDAFLMDPHSRASGEEMMLQAEGGKIVSISKKTDPRFQILGEATGILKLSRPAALELRKILKDFVRRGDVWVEYEEAYRALMRRRRLKSVKVGKGFWTEMDFESDLKKIRAFLSKQPRTPVPRRTARR